MAAADMTYIFFSVSQLRKNDGDEKKKRRERERGKKHGVGLEDQHGCDVCFSWGLGLEAGVDWWIYSTSLILVSLVDWCGGWIELDWTGLRV